MFPDLTDDDKRPMRAVVTSVLSGTVAGNSSEAFRVGVITSDKGYITSDLWEVNNLLPFFFETAVSLT